MGETTHLTRGRRFALCRALTAGATLLACGAAADIVSAVPAKKPAVANITDTNHAPQPGSDKQAEPSSPATHIPPSFPKTVDEAKAEAAAAKKPPAKWSDAEVADAKSRCAAILQRIDAVAIPHEPIKEGACGAPAPIELISIGKNPQVSLSPPAIITCNLAENLATWLERDLQPLAQKHLHAPIITIETMSSYSCRNAYGRKKSKLSEHALADAVDIRGFVTASAKTAYVLEDWGTPQREIVARIAAEKAAAEKQAADLAAANKAAQANLASDGGNHESATPTAIATPLGAPAAGIARSTIVDGIPKLTVTLPGANTPPSATSLSVAEPDRLGGPPLKPELISKPWTLIAVQPDDQPERNRAQREFLHEAHASACQIFGTTLGPEANAAHRNHIHVDMAPRPIVRICD